MTILGSSRALNGSRPGDIMHAQASSYLGVVFEHVGLDYMERKALAHQVAPQQDETR